MYYFLFKSWIAHPDFVIILGMTIFNKKEKWMGGWIF